MSPHFDFFISYASEDLEVAEALDKSLSLLGYKVWRDRGQLTLGDSLTAKINEGLSASRFGIVIISNAFLGKNWPQAELDALQARAIVEGKKIILPIRRDLNHEEMAKHLPLLGDKLTIAVTDNLDWVISEIERAAGIPQPVGAVITTPQNPKRNRRLLERLENLVDDPCLHPDINFDKDSCIQWANKVEVLLKESSPQYIEWVEHRTTMLQTHDLFDGMGYLINQMKNILDLAIKEIKEDIKKEQIT